jgi:hypothetical protein
MAATLEGPLGRWRSEWRANRRLRIGAVVIGAILALYTGLALNDWRRALAHEYEERSLHLYKVVALAGQTQWRGRAVQARDLRRALDAQIPSAGTIGLAQAEVQGWVNRLVSTGGREVSTDAKPPTLVDAENGVWKIPVTIRGAMTQRALVEMLRRIESGERLVTIEEANFENQQRLTVSLTVASYYRIGGRKPAEGASNARP